MGRKREKPLSQVMQRVLEACGVDDSVADDQRLGELAKRLGRPIGTVRNWAKRETGVPMVHLIDIAQRSGRPIQWLKEGHGSRNGSQAYPAAQAPKVIDAGGEDRGKAAVVLLADRSHVLDAGAGRFVVVPRYATRVSAGTGSGQVVEEQVGQFAFEINWMRLNLGRGGDGFVSVAVRGDSMQPTLLHGDEIIIDSHVRHVDVSSIYVIALRGELLVKRVQRKLDGSLIVKSDNAAYEPETVSAAQADDFNVIGRLVWPRVR